MVPDKHLIRKLSHIEQAFTISNETFPLCVVCVLHLTSGPEIRELKKALAKLQARHPLLRAGISKIKGRLSFQRLRPSPPLELEVLERKDAASWRKTAEHALNTKFEKGGPLLKCWYLPDSGQGNCALIVCFHHAIIDGISARLILHELLSLSGKVPLPEPPSHRVSPKFPPAFRKWNLLKRLLALAGRQLGEEWRYRGAGLASPIPEHSRNATISLRLSPALSRRLSVRAGRGGLSLNSVLLAAITQAVFRHRHSDQDAGLARVITIPGHISRKFISDEVIQFQPGTVAFDSKIKGFYIPVIIR